MTCIKFILEPASHIGDAISKFLKALLKDLPIALWPVVLVALLVGILLVVTMYFRYSICLFGLPILSAPKQEKLPAIDQQTLKQIGNQQEEVSLFVQLSLSLIIQFEVLYLSILNVCFKYILEVHCVLDISY